MERCNVNAIFPWNPWSDDISSTSTEWDKEAPYSLAGLPAIDGLVAVNLGADEKGKAVCGIGRLIDQPSTADDILFFQWVSNDKEDNSKAIHLGWRPSEKPAAIAKRAKGKKPKADEKIDDGIYFASEKKNSTDLLYTSKDTGTSVSASNVMLHGFSLTSKNLIPSAVKWAMERSATIFFDEHKT
jgi:hypothetical protein